MPSLTPSLFTGSPDLPHFRLWVLDPGSGFTPAALALASQPSPFRTLTSSLWPPPLWPGFQSHGLPLCLFRILAFAGLRIMVCKALCFAASKPPLRHSLLSGRDKQVTNQTEPHWANVKGHQRESQLYWASISSLQQKPHPLGYTHQQEEAPLLLVDSVHSILQESFSLFHSQGQNVPPALEASLYTGHPLPYQSGNPSCITAAQQFPITPFRVSAKGKSIALGQLFLVKQSVSAYSLELTSGMGAPTKPFARQDVSPRAGVSNIHPAGQI